MIWLYVLWLVTIYLLVADWAAFVPGHETAFYVELLCSLVLIVAITLLFLKYNAFYANGGRKVDLVFLLWLSRELIHTRVKFNVREKQTTELVSNLAIKDSFILK